MSVYSGFCGSALLRGHPRSVRVGAFLGQGCVPARCWATTGPHGPDSAVGSTVASGALRCRVVVTVSLLMVLTILLGTA